MKGGDISHYYVSGVFYRLQSVTCREKLMILVLNTSCALTSMTNDRAFPVAASQDNISCGSVVKSFSYEAGQEVSSLRLQQS